MVPLNFIWIVLPRDCSFQVLFSQAMACLPGSTWVLPPCAAAWKLSQSSSWDYYRAQLFISQFSDYIVCYCLMSNVFSSIISYILSVFCVCVSSKRKKSVPCHSILKRNRSPTYVLFFSFLLNLMRFQVHNLIIFCLGFASPLFTFLVGEMWEVLHVGHLGRGSKKTLSDSPISVFLFLGDQQCSRWPSISQTGSQNDLQNTYHRFCMSRKYVLYVEPRKLEVAFYVVEV